MIKVCLVAAFAFVLLGHSGVLAEEPKKIRDNSFLIEEAYNQESGVIQHIQTFLYTRDKSRDYTFTDEWPVCRETHQLSVTVPVSHIDSDGTETGIGDVPLNYRYQAALKDPIALAPRLSLILPTGNDEKGLGDPSLGFQVGIPASIELADKWVTHWNLGATYIPNAKGPNGTRRDLNGFFYGASLIYLLS
ncbi:MAG: transporter [Syntrophaceae bacterium]